MDNMDHSENNVKISDSAYSNSCSNSQSRRRNFRGRLQNKKKFHQNLINGDKVFNGHSHSSKSTHSGSNSSGSSGYGGKPSSGYSNNQATEKRAKDKESKKKKTLQGIQKDLQVTVSKNEIESIPEHAPIFSKEEITVCLNSIYEPTENSPAGSVTQDFRFKQVPGRFVPMPSPGLAKMEKGPELMDMSERANGKDEHNISNSPVVDLSTIDFVSSFPNDIQNSDGFSCVISMQDGIVMYATASISTALGYPQDLWIGRSFIDFLHQRDRNTFASQITSGIIAPKPTNDSQTKATAPALGELVSTMVCRIRRYKGLNSGFAVKDKVVSFKPFQLNFFFKSITEDGKEVVYLVIEASPYLSAFKTPNEVVSEPKPFIVRHAPNGKIDYIDPESVPYLGYLPQDIVNKDALQLYYPSDLKYLRQLYETVVREGSVERSKPYRMMAQNGDYLKLQTEWSSFTNPWSRKLEFVIGKHFIIEGPRNPDVFQTPEVEKSFKITNEEEAKAQALRESLVRIMNEVLTKPAEMAKQQMSKRCQKLASFMESLLESTPKQEEELRLDIQDADQSCFERDSVMLGGISPHHDFNDYNTSIETPLTYNQLNYNENLQRFFDCHEPYTEDDIKALALCENANILEMEVPEANHSASPVGEIEEMASSSDSSAVVLASTSRACNSSGYQSFRLTESLLNKHNVEMEKDLLKMHRETRTSKIDRDRASNESRQKMKEHLARCNAAYHPTNVDETEYQAQGLKRPLMQSDDESTHKHHCPKTRRRLGQNNQSSVPMSVTNNVPSPWPSHTVSNLNPYVVGMGLSTQMPVMRSLGVPGVVPVYYSHPMSYQIPQSTDLGTPLSHYHGLPNMPPVNAHVQYHAPHQMNLQYSTNTDPNRIIAHNIPPAYPVQVPNPQLQCMMMGQPFYGSSYLYTPINQKIPYGVQQNYMQQQVSHPYAFGLSNSNYEEACKLTMPMTSGETINGNAKREQVAAIERNNKDANVQDIGISSVVATKRMSDDAMVDERSRKKFRFENCDRNEKTDGESSYSSFYSSFLKTDSGSNGESDSKSRMKGSKASGKHKFSAPKVTAPSATVTPAPKERVAAKRKMEPPWMEQVCVTSDLLYKYQIAHKDQDEVLSSDKEKLKQLEQSALVSEQLSQLYMDLQLQGVAAKITLEEGITSSSSSGEDSPSNPKASTSQPRHRNREYSRLVMIYEEDAPMPPPDDNIPS